MPERIRGDYGQMVFANSGLRVCTVGFILFVIIL